MTSKLVTPQGELTLTPAMLKALRIALNSRAAWIETGTLSVRAHDMRTGLRRHVLRKLDAKEQAQVDDLDRMRAVLPRVENCDV